MLIAVLGGLVTYGWLNPVEEPAPAARTPAPDPAASARGDAPSRGSEPARLALPQRAPLPELRAELFETRSWDPPAPKPAAPTPPAAPPMPYRFAGQLIQGDRPEVLLAKGDAVIPVAKGDTLDGVYRIDSITETQITITYLPLKQTQTIPVVGIVPLAAAAGEPRPASAQTGTPVQSAAAPVPPAAAGASAAATAAAKPARLSWEGPPQVKLGAPFSVALKVTSEQPVRASPMQIRVDPSMFETVAVKAGRFFGADDRHFSYRVSPDGSIFIGAIGRGPEPAADAEFLVLTLRPLRTAAVAELSLASPNLVGSAGHLIAFDPLASFKAAVTP